jgi:hypothetical protein
MSVTKNHILEKWNELLLQFIEQLDNIFQDDEVKNIKAKYNVSKIFSKTMAISLFIKNVNPHGDEIMSKNEHYFFHKSSSIELTEGLDLKKYFTMTSVDNKEIIWQYLQGLYILSNGYNKAK